MTDFGTGIIEEDIPLGIPFLSNETSIHDDFGTTGIRIALCPNQAMVPLSDGTSAIIFPGLTRVVVNQTFQAIRYDGIYNSLGGLCRDVY